MKMERPRIAKVHIAVEPKKNIPIPNFSHILFLSLFYSYTGLGRNLAAALCFVYILNHGVTITYLIENISLRAIFTGMPAMMRNSTIVVTYLMMPSLL